MALKSENPGRGTALKEKRNLENGVEYILWGWKCGIRLHFKYRLRKKTISKQTTVVMERGPLEVSAMRPGGIRR